MNQNISNFSYVKVFFIQIKNIWVILTDVFAQKITLKTNGDFFFSFFLFHCGQNLGLRFWSNTQEAYRGIKVMLF